MLRWLQPIEHLEAMNDQLRSVGYPDGPTKFAHNSFSYPPPKALSWSSLDIREPGVSLKI